VLAALLVFGPNKIPEIARALKAAYREFNRVRTKVDETLTGLRQEIDLNFDDVDAAPALKPAANSLGAPQYPQAAQPDGPPLPVPEADDYLAPGQQPPPATPYTTDDYLREAGHG
jgi:Sec-independent protein translocase protein TatA